MFHVRGKTRCTGSHQYTGRDEKKNKRQVCGAETSFTLYNGKASTREHNVIQMSRINSRSHTIKQTNRWIRVALFLPKSLKQARHVTSEFHRIHYKLEEAENSEINESAKTPFHGKIGLRRQLRELGGRTSYQDASELTTTRHRTSKWVFSMITKLGFRPQKNRRPLALLEIGAVNTQLLSIPWLEVRAIDIQVRKDIIHVYWGFGTMFFFLNSRSGQARHPRIEQIDFFDLKPASCYDVVVSSMVP